MPVMTTAPIEIPSPRPLAELADSARLERELLDSGMSPDVSRSRAACLSRLSCIAREAGAEARGPLPQGDFLDALGIATRASRLAAGATPDEAAEIRAALHRLTAPEEMGTLFKVLVLTAPGLGLDWNEDAVRANLVDL